MITKGCRGKKKNPKHQQKDCNTSIPLCIQTILLLSIIVHKKLGEQVWPVLSSAEFGVS